VTVVFGGLQSRQTGEADRCGAQGQQYFAPVQARMLYRSIHKHSLSVS
jgi:hypothetical protein